MAQTRATINFARKNVTAVAGFKLVIISDVPGQSTMP